MAQMVFNEWYGDITVAQQRAYNKYNVSPSDHDELVAQYGASNHAAIAKAVVQFSKRMGCFSSYDMRDAERTDSFA